MVYSNSNPVAAMESVSLKYRIWFDARLPVLSSPGAKQTEPLLVALRAAPYSHQTEQTLSSPCPGQLNHIVRGHRRVSIVLKRSPRNSQGVQSLWGWAPPGLIITEAGEKESGLQKTSGLVRLKMRKSTWGEPLSSVKGEWKMNGIFCQFQKILIFYLIQHLLSSFEILIAHVWNMFYCANMSQALF